MPRAAPWLVFPMLLSSAMAYAGSESAECRSPRFADIGWSDITLTTALTTEILRDLGYQPKVLLLSTDVTYAAMANRQVDIFLGTWMPGLEAASQPYRDAGAIQKVRINLAEGAMETIAVPDYVYEAGIKTLADLAAHKSQFGGKIYGAEPGGNKPIELLISNNAMALETGRSSRVVRLECLGRSPKPLPDRNGSLFMVGRRIR